MVFKNQFKECQVMKHISVFVLSAVMLVLNIFDVSAENSTDNSLKFDAIRTVAVDSLEADIQFVLSNSNEVKINGETKVLSSLILRPTKGTLKISAGSYTFGQPMKLQISVPRTCLLDVSVVGKSHVFIPNMAAAVRITTTEVCQVTVEGCVGLVLTADGVSKTQINQIQGDMSLTLSDRSQLGIKGGDIGKSLITATENSRVSIAALIQSLNLTTKGSANIKLEGVREAFMWTGRGNERVLIKRLTGIAEAAANYDSTLIVDDAKLDTLLASASSTGKITIKGTATNAAFSARGASEIVIDKVTGKILRNSKMHNGSIKILNP
jgi:hypothetical protein